MTKTCVVGACDLPRRTRGWCNRHYLRWRKYGNPLAGKPSPTIYEPGTVCAVFDCNTRASKRTWCDRHYQRWAKSGDPLIGGPTPDGTTRGVNPEGYIYITRRSHPLARANGQVFEHRVVLFDSIGPGAHPCHWCGTSVYWELKYPRHSLGLVVDHLDNDPSNNELVNLVPSCGICNNAQEQRKKARRG